MNRHVEVIQVDVGLLQSLLDSVLLRERRHHFNVQISTDLGARRLILLLKRFVLVYHSVLRLIHLFGFLLQQFRNNRRVACQDRGLFEHISCCLFLFGFANSHFVVYFDDLLGCR